MFLQITQAYWDAHPEIQDTYKVGDQLEVQDTDAEISPEMAGNAEPKQAQSSDSAVLDGLGKEFIGKTGKIVATSRQITLNSGAGVAEIAEFKGKHVFQAQRFLTSKNTDGEADGGDMMPIIISLCTKINGQPIVPEDLNEMPGVDVLQLMGEFSAASFSKP